MYFLPGIWLAPQQRILRLLIAIPIAGACAVLYAINPSGGGYPVCPFYAITGLYCPGCGSLRATHQLLHGNLARAIDFNLLAVIVFPIFIYSSASAAVAVFRGRSLSRVFVSPGLLWVGWGLLIAYWVARNLPGPFSWLAPG